jgi:glycosyltransferase involved in cell wall biosynthesis
MIEAVNHPVLAGRARLLICGAIDDPGLREAMRLADRGRHVDYAGYLSRSEVARALGTARAGLVVLQPSQAYLDSLPVKLFEYLAAGRPIIASHFPVWRRLPGLNQVGLFVDPTSPAAIANAMRWILDRPTEAAALGRAGRALTREHFSWEREQAALLRLYAWTLPAPAVL